MCENTHIAIIEWLLSDMEKLVIWHTLDTEPNTQNGWIQELTRGGSLSCRVLGKTH